MTIELCIENYVHEGCRGLIWVVYRNFPWDTEENQASVFHYYLYLFQVQ